MLAADFVNTHHSCRLWLEAEICSVSASSVRSPRNCGAVAASSSRNTVKVRSAGFSTAWWDRVFKLKLSADKKTRKRMRA